MLRGLRRPGTSKCGSLLPLARAQNPCYSIPLDTSMLALKRLLPETIMVSYPQAEPEALLGLLKRLERHYRGRSRNRVAIDQYRAASLPDFDHRLP
jgi:hypothetical protein